MSDSDDTNAFKRELSDLLDRHLGQVESEELSESVDRVTTAVEEGQPPRDSSDGDDGDFGERPSSAKFERELSSLVESHVTSAESAAVSEVLDEVSRELQEGDIATHVGMTDEDGDPCIHIRFGSAFLLEQTIDEILEIQGLTLPLEDEPPVLEDLVLSFEPAGAKKPVELRARVVQTMSDKVALQVYEPDEQTRKRLQKLPNLMRLSKNSKRRRQRTTSTGLRPLGTDADSSKEKRSDRKGSGTTGSPSADEAQKHQQAAQVAAESHVSRTAEANPGSSSPGGSSFGNADKSAPNFSSRGASGFGRTSSRPSGSSGSASSTSLSSLSESSEARLMARIDALHEQAFEDNWFDVLGLHWSCHGRDVKRAGQKLERRIQQLEAKTPGREAQDKLAEIRERVEKAHSFLSSRENRRQLREKHIERNERNSALRILENKLQSLSMRSSGEELRDTCRSILELDPEHSMARELLYGD